MKNPLVVSTIQYDIVWENPKANLEKLSLLIETIEKTDVRTQIQPSSTENGLFTSLDAKS